MDSHNNQLIQALEAGRIRDFLVGEPPFFITLPDHPDDHSPIRAWLTFMVPVLDEKLLSDRQLQIVKSAMMDLMNEEDKAAGIYHLIGNLFVYYSLVSENRIAADIVFTDTDLAAIGKCLTALKPVLEKDTRWTGASWHSNNGLWGPLTKDVELIAQRGGPLIPLG